MPTVPDHGGAAHSLLGLVAGRAGSAIGEIFVTSRLDREVSGVVVLATTREAEGRLRDARERGTYRRRYVAIAGDTGTLIKVDPVDQRAGAVRVWDTAIGRGKDARHRAVGGPDAKEAATRWRAIARAGRFVLLAVEPQTGRTHQIRVHASHAGAPLLGDRDYGAAARVALPGGRVLALSRIALHAARVTVPGKGDGALVAEAGVPEELRRAWSDLGGAPEAWDTAVSCAFDP
jgi:23S rRNA pseudouridine955/2504/2580 synthase/23S rRNA pseudouridine1911/1915/1917 synthase